ncbi:hypothetical protein [Rathayibacter oskolensis]|uniref:hypothetical protein n=1 Tax=Rathayibacter oskolensis TaxID=1891671 RepID=UPI0034677F78
MPSVPNATSTTPGALSVTCWRIGVAAPVETAVTLFDTPATVTVEARLVVRPARGAWTLTMS